MPKMLYTNEITDKIIEIISRVGDLKSVVKGDLEKVPSPELFSSFMPMVIVKPLDIENEWANIEQKILASTYNFKIFYLRQYNLENQTELLNLHEECIREAEPIAELLLDTLTLEDLKTDNGYVTSTDSNRISFSNANMEFFRELNVPLAIVEIDFAVRFRTYSNRRKGIV